MATRLTKMELDEISLVDAAANPKAKVVLFKRAEPDAVLDRVVETIRTGVLPDLFVTKAGRKISAARLRVLTDLRDALSAMVADTTPEDKELPMEEAKKADLTKLSKAAQDVLAAAGVTELTDEQAAKFTAALPKAPEPEPKPEDVLKGLDPAAKAFVEKAMADATAATARVVELQAVVKAEQNKVATRYFIEKALTLDALPGMNADDFGVVLKGIAEKAPEDWAKLEPLLKSAHAAIKTGALYVEKGRGGEGGGSAFERATTMAKEKVAKSLAKTENDALADVWRENPSLYTEYRNEMATRIAGRSSE